MPIHFEGFSGLPDPDERAWLDRMPVIREFRRKVLGARKSR